jgi:hypothetical protein
MATATQTYRVYRISEGLRKAVIAKREAENCPTKAVLDAAVTSCLPKIVKALTTISLGPQSKARPVRWPVDDELLGALRVAAKQTGVPASRLLLASLAMLTAKKGAK